MRACVRASFNGFGEYGSTIELSMEHKVFPHRHVPTFFPVCCYQVEAIRRGIGAVIPVQLLRLFSWDDLEMFVCGQEGVDIDLLEACTEYNLCSREDKHVSAFWDVLRSFSQKEKSLFLRHE